MSRGSGPRRFMPGTRRKPIGYHQSATFRSPPHADRHSMPRPPRSLAAFDIARPDRVIQMISSDNTPT
jgi:hypothetical protein